MQKKKKSNETSELVKKKRVKRMRQEKIHRRRGAWGWNVKILWLQILDYTQYIEYNMMMKKVKRWQKSKWFDIIQTLGNCETTKTYIKWFKRKQIHKQVLGRPSVLNERLVANLVPLRAERSESVPALFCYFWITFT